MAGCETSSGGSVKVGAVAYVVGARTRNGAWVQLVFVKETASRQVRIADDLVCSIHGDDGYVLGLAETSAVR